MCYDLLVLLLSVVKLSYEPSKSPLKERLRAQGILYFTVAAIANILPTVCTPPAPSAITYSLLSAGFFFPWFRRYDRSLFGSFHN